MNTGIQECRNTSYLLRKKSKYKKALHSYMFAKAGWTKLAEVFLGNPRVPWA